MTPCLRSPTSRPCTLTRLPAGSRRALRRGPGACLCTQAPCSRRHRLAHCWSRRCNPRPPPAPALPGPGPSSSARAWGLGCVRGELPEVYFLLFLLLPHLLLSHLRPHLQTAPSPQYSCAAQPGEEASEEGMVRKTLSSLLMRVQKVSQSVRPRGQSLSLQ